MSNDLYLQGLCYVSSWEVLLITGSDAPDLLNRILTLNVKKLEPGQGSWAFLLDHRGQIKQAMWLLKRSDHHFLAISETGLEELSEAIDLFIFGEDVQLVPLKEHLCIYLSERSSSPSEPLWSEAIEGWSGYLTPLFHSNDKVHSSHENTISEQLLIGEKSLFSTLGITSVSDSEFKTYRIHLGGALPSREYREGTPLDVSLDGISEGKGCYPGQEVIERTIALGKPAQTTLKLTLYISIVENAPLDRLLQAGEEERGLLLFERTENDELGRELGVITSLADDQERLKENLRVEAIIKLKSRYASFEAPLLCYITPRDNEIQKALERVQIKASIERKG